MDQTNENDIVTSGTVFNSGAPIPTRKLDINSIKDDYELDMSDPFERAIFDIVKMNRAKRRDYALDNDPFSNFRATSKGLGLKGFGPVESAIFNVLQKLARLESLRANGRINDPTNESVNDTYLDLAVYSVIAYAMVNDGIK